MKEKRFDYDVGALVRRAYSDCSFYRDLYSRHGVNVDEINAAEELCRLPIVTPDDLANAPQGFRSSRARVYRITSSSGTAYKPKTLYRTQGDSQLSTDIMCRLFSMAGLMEGETLWIGQPFDLAHLGYLSLEACRRMNVLALPGGLSVTDSRLRDLLRQHRPTAIFTSPSRMCQLTAMFAEDPGRPPLRHILLAGEPCSEQQLDLLRRAWRIEPHNLYGSEETDGLAGSCSGHDGLHFMNDMFHLELLEPGTDRPAATGEVGEAVITSLYSEGTPLIRYRLGDLIEWLPGQCSCGAPWPRIRVLGRSSQTFFLYDGIKFHSGQMKAAVQSVLGNVDRFQAVLRRDEDGLEEIELILPEAAATTAVPQLARLEDALWSSSLDLDAARAIGRLKFRISTTGQYFITRRGKSPEFIDLRDEQQAAQYGAKQ